MPKNSKGNVHDDTAARVVAGRIILARFLDRSSRFFEDIVAQIDHDVSLLRLSSPDSETGAAAVTLGLLEGVFWETNGEVSSRAIAGVLLEAGVPRPLYRSMAFAREYRVNAGLFDHRLAQGSEECRIRMLRLLSRMRLVNSCNRLTHGVLRELVEQQATFVTTGDPALLLPLRQKELLQALAMRSDGHWPMADASRVSRVLAAGSLKLNDGSEVEWSRLCPGPRAVHRELVKDVLRRERARMAAGELEGPVADLEIARAVSARCSIAVSRRTVTFIRKELGIPDCHARARRESYLTATAGFSALRPATTSAIRDEVVQASGVYELRIAGPGIEYPAGLCPVVYVGGSGNVRERLLEQLRGCSRNARLASHLAGGQAQVRWMPVPDCWRARERHIYRQFTETFGAHPECNAISP